MNPLISQDVSIARLLRTLHRHSLVVLTADHGASWLGKGSPYEAGVAVPLVMRWRGVLPPKARFNAPVLHLDLFSTLLAVAAGPQRGTSSPEGKEGSVVHGAHAHGTSLLPAILAGDPAGVAARRALDARPIFIEVGYARAVRYRGYKLIVVNDPYAGCTDGGDGTSDGGGCMNLHGERINKSVARFGLGNMTYDAPARHPAFCQRRQVGS